MSQIYLKSFLILVLALILIVYNFDFISNNIRAKIPVNLNNQAQLEINESTKIKTKENDQTLKVLAWNIKILLGSSKKLFCPKSNCAVITNRKSSKVSDAIIFSWQQLRSNGLPPVLTNQKWILRNYESPHHSKGWSRLPLKKIDWTMTYRTDSDIFDPYGTFVECNTTWKQSHSFENKTKSIAWFVSDCRTPSNREKYVKILKKYIDVDIYGSCGRLKCRRKNPECDEMMAKNYKFYLSFENSVK